MKRGIPTIVDPLRDIGDQLLDVEKPSRYLGGEFGSVARLDPNFFASKLSIALCFPDLYEIGMSNNAIRILYSGLRGRAGVAVERVFAPAPDFEALLRRLDLPLYSLESGLALSDLDLLCFSLGYELAATSLIAVLESGRVPIRVEERGEGAPIVMAGGPAATNPHPLAAFLDAVYIGEAEAGFFDLAEQLAVMKASGAGRSDLLERLKSESAIWMPSRGDFAGKRATRALFSGFSESVAHTALPLPSVKTVQDHGTVEIMRGCPNGCRFCHAGFFYRPQREKPYEAISSEVAELVASGGYREITLSSLSSGDYSEIGELLDRLNAEYASRRVSFQLPSLKINSFTLPIVGKLAEVRKSGLTFAVETPVDEWQRSINKDVSFERTLAILQEAKASGFKQAKFYFMIGLPVPGRGMGEAKAIVDFFDRLFSRINLQINVNVGTFVPKPHTPYERCAQLSEDEALSAVTFLRAELRRFKTIKLSYHSPFVSQLEGIIARGDERVGELLLEAYRKGARLDAWEERFDRELWRSVIESATWDVVGECCGERAESSPLPWDDIGLRVSRSYLAREKERSEAGEFTSPCSENCTNPCGSCSQSSTIVQKSKHAEVITPPAVVQPQAHNKPRGRMVFRYSKTGTATYLQHLSIIDAFDRAFLMNSIPVVYSEGFNPMPRFETTQPIPIAVSSLSEIASALLLDSSDPQGFIDSLNASLPKGLRIEEAAYYPVFEGKKLYSLGSLEWGSEYRIEPRIMNSNELEARLETLIAGHDGFRLSTNSDNTVSLRLPMPKSRELGVLRLLEQLSEERPIQKNFDITRIRSFAHIESKPEPVSFFDAYSSLQAQ